MEMTATDGDTTGCLESKEIRKLEGNERKVGVHK